MKFGVSIINLPYNTHSSLCIKKSCLFFNEGMTEGSGPETTTTRFLPDYWKLGSVGKAFVGMEMKLDNPDPKTGEGEVIC